MGYEFDSQNKLLDLNISRTLYKANIYHKLNPDSKLRKDNNNIIISRNNRINIYWGVIQIFVEIIYLLRRNFLPKLSRYMIN